MSTLLCCYGGNGTLRYYTCSCDRHSDMRVSAAPVGPAVSTHVYALIRGSQLLLARAAAPRAERCAPCGAARADAQLRWVQALASVTAPVLLVDGYNIIFASRRLARLASLRGLDAARERLVNEVRAVRGMCDRDGAGGVG
jgi:hypothetical protein